MCCCSDLSDDEDLIEKLKSFKMEGNTRFGLQHFDYNNDVIATNIHSHLAKTNFTGIVVSDSVFLWYPCQCTVSIKGNISFNKNGSRRVDSAEIRQFRFQGKHFTYSLSHLKSYNEVSNIINICIHIPGDNDTIVPVLIGKVRWDEEFNFVVQYYEDLHSIWPGIKNIKLDVFSLLEKEITNI